MCSFLKYSVNIPNPSNLSYDPMGGPEPQDGKH